jgi:hypothetical protein
VSATKRKTVRSTSRLRATATIDTTVERSTSPDADALAYIARVRAARDAAKSTRAGL